MAIDKIGRFTILDTLGSGAHSSILHIRREEDSREYALKLVAIENKEDMKFLEQANARVREHAAKLFQYDPAQKFTCYDRPLGQLANKPGLGNPLPLMKEIYEQSKAFVEQQAGPGR